jgi:hypothetical protein
MDAPMDDRFVHIEGHLEANQRARLLDLLRRVEATGNFRFKPEGLVATWIVVLGWNSQGGDSGRPVSISRYKSPLRFNGWSIEAVMRKMERWLGKHRDEGGCA